VPAALTHFTMCSTGISVPCREFGLKLFFPVPSVVTVVTELSRVGALTAASVRGSVRALVDTGPVAELLKVFSTVFTRALNWSLSLSLSLAM
jgi:hypothetical protein